MMKVLSIASLQLLLLLLRTHDSHSAVVEGGTPIDFTSGVVFDPRCNTVSPIPGAPCDTTNFDKLECVLDGSLACTCNSAAGSGTWNCRAGASVSTSVSTVNSNGNSNSNVRPVSFYGLNYNTRKGPDWAADRERCKSRSEVIQDLTLLSRITTRIRLLSLVDCEQGSLVWSVLTNELSSTTTMEVYLGLWVGPDPQVFIDEYDALAGMLPGILATDDWKTRLTGISVGSEAIYREDITIEEAIANLDSTRALLEAYNIQNDVSVAIVDIAPIYSQSQQLRIASDVIMTNTFPFWEGLPVSAAVDELEEDLGWLTNLPESQGKPFILSEHGWPSGGVLDGVGVASPDNQQQYLAESYCYLKEKGWAYYWFTAIDNDWRQIQDPNNSIEGNWGFLKADLSLKDHLEGFEFSCGDGSTYSFGGDSVDWSIPELQPDDSNKNGEAASCGLWQGCEALAGDCCPTPEGDYLGCCRSEFFLGTTTTTTTTTAVSSTSKDAVVPVPAAPTSSINGLVGVPVTATPGTIIACAFCVGQDYLETPIIVFATGNDSVSCAGFRDLIAIGMTASYCELERAAIETACCRPLDGTGNDSGNDSGNGNSVSLTAPPTNVPVPASIRTPVPATLEPTNPPVLVIVPATPEPTDGPTGSCDFCTREELEFVNDPIISLSGNDSVSCGGLKDLLQSGLSSGASSGFCETERAVIEEACCQVRGTTPNPTKSPTKAPTQVPTGFPTQIPTGAPTNVATLPPTELPTPLPTKLPTSTPTVAAVDAASDGPTADLSSSLSSITSSTTLISLDEPMTVFTKPPTLPPTTTPTSSQTSGDPVVVPTPSPSGSSIDGVIDVPFSIFPMDEIDGAAFASGSSSTGIGSMALWVGGMAMLWSAFVGW